MSDRLAALLEGLLEPLVEERLSAAEALALLRGDTALTPARCALLEASCLHQYVCAERSMLCLPLFCWACGDGRLVSWQQCSYSVTGARECRVGAQLAVHDP